jgi:RNA polymerase sigma-70 factor, ECF subfamily
MAGSDQPEWFEPLLQSYYRRLIAFACGLLGATHQADDVVQEVFVAAWRAAQQRTPPFGATLDEIGAHRWLFRVAYRRAISLRRHNSAITCESLDALDELDEPAPPAAGVGSPVAVFEDRVAEGEALAAALARLSSVDAACVLLHIVHGFTAPEVAQILEVSPEAAKKRLWRATERLRAAYFAPEARVAGEQVRR